MEIDSLGKNSSTIKSKRAHPSAKEAGPSRKIVIKTTSESTTSSQTNISKQKKILNKFTKNDKGPYKVIINIKKDLITSGMRSPSDLTIAHDLTKKYNIHFENIIRRGKFSWIVAFANRDLANMAISNQFIPESKYEIEIPWNIMFRRFIIKGVPTDLEENYILEELKTSNPDLVIEEIYRFKKKIYVYGEPSFNNIGTVKVTIRGQTFPEKVNMWGLKVSTSVFIPNIRQCFKCGQLNHATKFCQNTVKCLRCGDDYNPEHEICDKQPKCLNCGREHPTLDKDCPEIIFKKEITQLMALRNIEFNEARRILRPGLPTAKDMANFPPLQHHSSNQPPDSEYEEVFRNNNKSLEIQGSNKKPK